MGTVLEGVAVASRRRRRHVSARKLADAAARQAIASAGLAAGDVDVLVNTGLYHDRNLGEPALAALIQEDIGANPEDPHEGSHGTFSFDLANGACGMLSALRVADGFLRAGTIRHALIVASDADPGRGLAPRFPFDPAGGAVVVGWQEGGTGIAGFRSAASPAGNPDGGLARAVVSFEDGRNVLRIEQHPGFVERTAALASGVARALLAEHDLSPGDVDTVIANPLTPEFLDELGRDLEIDPGRIVRVPGSEHVHTAGLAVALDRARHEGRLASGQRVLLLSAGAGINASAGILYC